MLNEVDTEPVTLEAVLETGNLRAAWLSVKANNGSPGIDGMDVEQSAVHLRKHWETIAANLLGAITPRRRSAR